jgi:precorrin-3B C17-methyltransferase
MEVLQLQSPGRIQVVGIGPGSLEDITLRATSAIAQSDYVIGVSTYIDQISSLLRNQKVIKGAMGEEVQRVKKAIELASEGNNVSIVSGGDPNVFGMGSLVLELLAAQDGTIDVEIVPGVTAVNAVAAILGAPLSSDYAIISLSDLLIPWADIEKRLTSAAESGFVIALYNPQSRRRKRNLARSIELLKKHRPHVPVGIVQNGTRPGEMTAVTTLETLMEHEAIIDMHTTIIVGNRESFVWKDKIITPRGYQRKYGY